MRNKGLNNNLTDTISKGGVLYRPGEIPVLTKEQLAQANLVSKLPHDFPFANWEGMTTKQQLREIKSSGLNAQDQWTLLNTNVPLSVLNQHNQAQDEVESRAYATRIAVSLMNTIAQAAVPPTPTPSKNPSNNTPLQSNGLKQKLNMLKEEYDKKPLGKAAGGIGAAAAPKAKGNVTANVGVGFIGHEEHKSDSKPSSTPQMITFETEPPTKTPKMTSTPKSTSTPTAEITRRQELAQNIVDTAEIKARKAIRYQKGGGSDERGYDCSGLVRTLLKAVGSGIKFGQGYISYSCEDGMAKDLIESKCCDVKYDYSKSGSLPALEPGDLVFFADFDDLSTDKHVAIATGNDLQVVEASDVVHKVTDEFDAYERYDKGQYIRESGQIITYVLKPYYDWKG